MKKIFLTVAVAIIAFTGNTLAQNQRGGAKNEVKTEQSATTFEEDDDMPEAQKGDKKSRTPQMRAKHRLTKMDEQLTLSPDQENKINTLLIGFFTKKEDLRKQFGADEKMFKKERNKLQKELNTSIEAVLTPEQKTIWDAAKAEKKEKHQEGKGKHKGKKAE